MTLRKTLLTASMLAIFFAIILCTPQQSFAGTKVEKDKTCDNSIYVYSGANFRATCLIDELIMPYYQATITAKNAKALNAAVKKQKSAANRWLKKNTKKKHTYKITFKKCNKKTKKWTSVSKYTIKKTYSRKIKCKVTKKSSTKAIVYAEVKYAGKDETFIKTKKFSANTKYVEYNTNNDSFSFTKDGKFHWEVSEDDEDE